MRSFTINTIYDRAVETARASGGRIRPQVAGTELADAIVFRASNVWLLHNSEWSERRKPKTQMTQGNITLARVGAAVSGMSIRPTVDRMWIEATSHDPRVDVHPCCLVVYNNPSPRALAKWGDFQRQKSGVATTPAQTIRIHAFILTRFELHVVGDATIALTESGVMSNELPIWMDIVGDVGSADADLSQRVIDFATYTLGFLNCRNVVVTECVPSRAARRDAERRRAIAPVTYRVLDIDPVGESRVVGIHGDEPRPTARHICRGHFKRFTQDRPLLGKHVGQFWWPQHLRGDSVNGLVVKDYEIHTSA